MSRNFNGLKRYEPLLKTICGIEEYAQLSDSDWEGCLGIACVISVIEGVQANLFSLSKHLDIPGQNDSLRHAFERLRINGIFTAKYNVKGDPCLTSNASDKEWIKGSHRERNAWCIIAGVASGKAGIRGWEKEEEEVVEETPSRNVMICPSES
ncbi:MAG: hypothetical protein ACTSSP_02135 [Candidatus Asgardarchaeia archaeon]